MKELSQELMMQLAKLTWTAEKENHTISPISETYPDITLEQAYQMQILREKLMVAEGHRVIGGKMGLTSLAKMKQMGMNKPPTAGCSTTCCWRRKRI